MPAPCHAPRVGAEVAASIREVALDGGEEPAAVLLWLQRNGTLHQGLPALCVAVSVLAPQAPLARTNGEHRG